MRPWSLRSSLRDLARRRDLIAVMAATQVRARYQQSLLGLGWAVLQPLALMLLFTFIFHKFLRVSSEGLPYPVFSYAALVPWSFFATSLTLGVPSLVLYAAILKKVYFPREIFPLVTILATVFDLVIAAAVLLGMMMVYRVFPGPSALWVLPLLGVQTAFTIGVVLFGAALCARVRDLQWGVPILVQVWMYCTPIIYSLDAVPGPYRWALLANPMTGLIDGYRRALLHGRAPDAVALFVSAGVSLAVFYLGYRFFKRREMGFADVL